MPVSIRQFLRFGDRLVLILKERRIKSSPLQDENLDIRTSVHGEIAT